jgi:hypothetical protein
VSILKSTKGLHSNIHTNTHTHTRICAC